MGLVLQYISDSSDGKVKVYDSQKRFNEDGELHTFDEFDGHKWIEQPKDKSQLLAEDKLSKSSPIERPSIFFNIIHAEDFNPLLIDTSLPPKVQRALSFYRNRREDVSKPNGELYSLKQEFDMLPKEKLNT